MYAVLKTEAGPGHTSYTRVPNPVVGASQLLVDVHYAGVCGSDLHIEDADIALRVRPPVVMGHEFVGTVRTVGAGVTDWAIGDLLVAETAFHTCGHCRMCLSAHDNVCAEKELIGYAHNGVFAPHVLVPASRAHHATPAPDGSVRSLALCEPLAGVVHGLVEQVGLKPDDRVVVAGPGPVGLLSVQVARASGARVLLLGRSSARLSLGRALGAECTVDGRDDDAVAKIRAWAGDDGCDVFVECAGSAALPAVGFEVLGRRGAYLQQGLCGAPVAVPIDLVAYKELRVLGTLGQKRSAWEQALRLVAAGDVDLDALVSDVYPLAAYADAFAAARARTGIKVLLQPGPDDLRDE